MHSPNLKFKLICVARGFFFLHIKDYNANILTQYLSIFFFYKGIKRFENN